MYKTIAGSTASLWLNLVFALILIINFSFWLRARTIIPEWDNVPPVPTAESTGFASMGDPEIAYRLYGYMLQNVGNTGGRYESLKKYDYASLEKWFRVSNALDPQANYIPFLAAYYFGTLFDEPEKMRHVASYLADAGMDPYPEKWRWLAQAVFLARHRINDLPLALDYANTLAKMPDVAIWARQMPAFVQLGMDNKQASYEIMIRILMTEGEKLHPNEVNYMKDFICTRTLSKEEAQENPLCRDTE